MKLIKILKNCDFCGLYMIVYMEAEEDPIWEGKPSNVPWWLAHLHLDDVKRWGEEPFSYRPSLGEKYDNQPGIVVVLKDN